jgi:polysaccharide deacetylase family protein (PEP-CTERM system associated)
MTAAPRAIVNAMSVDVEDYFQVSAFDRVVPRESWNGRESRVGGNTQRLLELFDSSGVRATFFVLGWVAERYPHLVRRIAEHGHEIASHGNRHELVYNLTPEQFRLDVRRAKAVLEQVAGAPVIGYRAPSYSVTERSLWALDVLIEEGYTYDASIFPIHHDRYGIPDSPRHVHVRSGSGGSIVEAPGSTVRFGGINFPVGGGGYFRLLPYAVTRWAFRRLNGVEGRPVVFYLHPWEIDPYQPRIAVDPITRLRHYTNLGRTESRLRRLMSEFSFATVREVVEGAGASAPDGVSGVAVAPSPAT